MNLFRCPFFPSLPFTGCSDEHETTDVSEEDMAKNHIENMQFSFKHPIIYSNKKIYKKWDCGYIFCVVILKVQYLHKR